MLVDLANQLPTDPTGPEPGITDFNVLSGMLGRNTFWGPGFWNLDAGLYKNFRITEGKSLQLRGEFYNLFNHSNLFLNGASTEISSSTFVEGFRNGRRNVQLALKFIF